MKKEYAKPSLQVVQLQYQTMLLDIGSVNGEQLHYGGSDSEYVEVER